VENCSGDNCPHRGGASAHRKAKSATVYPPIQTTSPFPPLTDTLTGCGRAQLIRQQGYNTGKAM